MSDEALIVDKTGSIFLAGSYLVKAAIGEVIDNETLGGATTHCEISGVTDNKYASDEECLDAIRDIFSKLGDTEKAGFNRRQPAAPIKDPQEIYGLLPRERVKPYNTMDIIKCLVDDSKFTPYKADYGKSLICGSARIDGWAVGIVANQRLVVKNSKGEMRMGGVIYSDSADKALVVLQDVSGFMVGSRAEHGGIIKDGAKMVNAMANSVVPKFTIIIGNSYGAGNYAMCGKAYDPRLIFSWPSAEMAVMSGSSAAKTMLQIKISAAKSQGEPLTEEQEQEYLDQITQRYNQQLSPYYAAARLWIDGVIDPLETRKVISMGIESANHAPIKEKFNVGVIQT